LNEDRYLQHYDLPYLHLFVSNLPRDRLTEES
jgi:hypothetical protein